jgi:hypothetical protein
LGVGVEEGEALEDAAGYAADFEHEGFHGFFGPGDVVVEAGGGVGDVGRWSSEEELLDRGKPWDWSVAGRVFGGGLELGGDR